MRKEYSDLLLKVDTFVEEKTKLFSSKMKCKPGCFTCCATKLTVTKLEAEAISEFIEEQKLELPSEAHHKNLCMNLNSEGRCLIYPVRPIVCRSHGLPLDYKEGAGKVRTVCPKNFQGEKISNLELTDVLNMDTVNILLGMLNKHLLGTIERVELESLGRIKKS